jgi:hypothetical protein
MYEAEKKRICKSPVNREEKRKSGPAKKEISNSINMKAMEREQEEKEEEEEKRAEKAFALFMERAKEEKLRQKRCFRRVWKPKYSIDKKKEFATNVLDYLAVNKGEPSDPKTWTHTRKNGKQTIIANDDVNEVESLSSDVDLNDYRRSNTDRTRRKKDKRKLPLTLNDEELYPNWSLIEHGKIKRARTGGWKKKTQLSSYIDIDKLDIDPEKIIPEDGEHMENYLTNDDIEYLDRNDLDFQRYYLHNLKTFQGIDLGGGTDGSEDTLPYPMKIMFLASKVCQLKTQYWSAKYHDINNRLRDWMYSDTIWSENSTAKITPDPKVIAEKKINYENQGREGRRIMRMKER